MISFCTQIKNRLHQFRLTFEYNATVIGGNKDLEWVIVDAGSTDGLETYMRQCLPRLERVYFYQAIDQPYAINVFKNFATRLSSGKYVFNLDADNFIDMRALDGQDGVLCCQGYGVGSYGRIGCPRELFQELGGYDESFMPVGGHDLDFLERCKMVGCKLLDHKPARRPIHNTKADTVRNIDNPLNLTWKEMNLINLARMEQNLRSGVFCPNKKFNEGDFLLNFGDMISLGDKF